MSERITGGMKETKGRDDSGQAYVDSGPSSRQAAGSPDGEVGAQLRLSSSWLRA